MEILRTPREAAAHTRRILSELAELAGQGGKENEPPTLELQFDDILTRTSLTEDGEIPLLSITAFLPRTVRRMEEVPLKVERMLWDADEGRYVMLRHVPAATLEDERSLMDAILETYDDAKAWLTQDEDVES